MGNTLWKDEYTLLCESCGYVIEGLDPTGRCPECGKPIKESLPERRVGTPWQQKPGFKTLVKTWWMTLRHPFKTISVLRLEGSHGFKYCLLTLLLSTSVMLIGIAPLYVIEGGFTLGTTLASTGILVSLYFAVSLEFFALWCRGTRKSARRKEIRIPYDTSWQITAHASSYFTLIPFGVAMWLWMDTIHQVMRNSIYFLFGVRLGSYFATSFELVFYSVFAYAIIIQFCVFDAFAVHRCKYANRVRPISELSEPTQTDTRMT